MKCILCVQPTHLISRAALIGDDINILGYSYIPPFSPFCTHTAHQTHLLHLLIRNTTKTPFFFTLFNKPYSHFTKDIFLFTHLPSRPFFFQQRLAFSRHPSWLRLIDNFNLGLFIPRLKQLAAFPSAIRRSFSTYNDRELVLSLFHPLFFTY